MRVSSAAIIMAAMIKNPTISAGYGATSLIGGTLEDTIRYLTYTSAPDYAKYGVMSLESATLVNVAPPVVAQLTVITNDPAKYGAVSLLSGTMPVVVSYINYTDTAAGKAGYGGVTLNGASLVSTAPIVSYTGSELIKALSATITAASVGYAYTNVEAVKALSATITAGSMPRTVADQVDGVRATSATILAGQMAGPLPEGMATTAAVIVSASFTPVGPQIAYTLDSGVKATSATITAVAWVIEEL